VGVDRWPIDLAHKRGLRGGFLRPVGGRWLVGFWSRRPLACGFTQQARSLLYPAASAIALSCSAWRGGPRHV